MCVRWLVSSNKWVLLSKDVTSLRSPFEPTLTKRFQCSVRQNREPIKQKCVHAAASTPPLVAPICLYSIFFSSSVWMAMLVPLTSFQSHKCPLNRHSTLNNNFLYISVSTATLCDKACALRIKLCVSKRVCHDCSHYHCSNHTTLFTNLKGIFKIYNMCARKPFPKLCTIVHFVRDHLCLWKDVLLFSEDALNS